MIDRKKVVKGLECCFAAANCDGCPYEIERRKIPLKTPENHCPILDDVLVLLKAQEPKQIIRKQGKQENSDGSIDYFGEWYCPHCGKLLNRGFDLPWVEFCYKCGGAVKWE